MNTALTQSLQPTDKPGITEVVLTSQDEGLAMLMPMLAHLSRESRDRWLTWISPKGLSTPLDKQVLKSYGFTLEHIRIIRPEDSSESLWLLWDALANGTSANVVANLGALSESDRLKLESACYKGNSRGLVIRSR